MPSRYSKELIAECIACFREEDGIELTPEEAVEYLAGLGGLFLAFAGVGAPGAARLEAAAKATPSTGVRNTCGTLQDAS